MFSRKLQYFLTFCLVSGILVFCSNRTLAGDGIDFQVNIVPEIVPEEEAPRPTIGGGGMPARPTPPEGGFRILINDGAEYTNSPTVTLKLFGGPNTERMAISNNPEFTGLGTTGQVFYQSSHSWDICRGQKECPEGTYTVYAKFYTLWGTASEIVSFSIVYTKKPIVKMIVEQIQNKIEEVLKKIVNLRKQIARLFKKEVVVEVPERPSEEIVPPVKKLPKEEIISPEEIPSEKEKVKEGPIYLLKEYGKWLWQSVQVLWNRIWSGLQKKSGHFKNMPKITKICQYCKKEFKTRNIKAKYCSIECMGKAFRKK